MENPESIEEVSLRDALVAGTATVAAQPLGLIAQASELAFPGSGYSPQTARTFAPVKVARNRIIRTVVGLRPFRPEGFVIRADRLGSKLLIHNYGHGGSGVTLSWGTSSLAVDLARSSARFTTQSAKSSAAFCGARLRSNRTNHRTTAARSVSGWTRNGDDLRERVAAKYYLQYRRGCVAPVFCV